MNTLGVLAPTLPYSLFGMLFSRDPLPQRWYDRRLQPHLHALTKLMIDRSATYAIDDTTINILDKELLSDFKGLERQMFLNEYSVCWLNVKTSQFNENVAWEHGQPRILLYCSIAPPYRLSKVVLIFGKLN